MIDFDALDDQGEEEADEEVEGVAALPSLDGFWEGACDYFRTGRDVTLRMQLSGAGGHYWVSDHASNALSDVSCERLGPEPQDVTVNFRWANRNGRTGCGQWRLRAAGTCLDGGWTEDGREGGPWKWTCLRHDGPSETTADAPQHADAWPQDGQRPPQPLGAAAPEAGLAAEEQEGPAPPVFAALAAGGAAAAKPAAAPAASAAPGAERAAGDGAEQSKAKLAAQERIGAAPKLEAMLEDLAEAYASPDVQRAVRGVQSARNEWGLSIKEKDQATVERLREIITPVQTAVFERHGYPVGRNGVRLMKINMYRAVAAGNQHVARLGTRLSLLLGMMPIGQGVPRQRPEVERIEGAVERQAASLSRQSMKDVTRSKRDTREKDGAEKKVLEDRRRAIKEHLIHQALQEPFMLKKGSSNEEWRHPWADQLVLSSRAVGAILRDGFVVVENALEAELVAAAQAEAVEMHRQRRLLLSKDPCSKGSRRLFLHFGTALEQAYHRAGLPGLWGIASRLAGLPAALAEAAKGMETHIRLRMSGLRVETSVMVSAYERGVHYRRHLDSFGDNGRFLTILAYLNEPTFDIYCGGQLRIFKDMADDNGRAYQDTAENDDITRQVDVVPAAGTVVIFQSRRVWHEVLPAKMDRYGMTLWVPGP